LAKLILLVLAGLVAYLLIRNYSRRIKRGDDAPRPAQESMVRCAECGVHHPRSESLLSAGKFYCSAEHERRSRNGG
jgi:uncharacterized protein